MFKLILIVLGLVYLCDPIASYLQVKDKAFYYNGQKVFLSGANLAWKELNYDWGDGKYQQHRADFNKWLAGLSSHGGNAARVWLHFGGQITPVFDKNGYTVGTDKSNDLVNEVKILLDDAEKHNVFIIFCLFTTQIFETNSGFITDESKIQSYIDKALKPIVEGVKGKKALAAWELMNEPETVMDITHKDSDSSPCFATDRWHHSNSNMGSKKRYPIKSMLRFFNWITAAIHSFDSSALVSNGAWNPRTNTDKCSNCYNLWRDECLIRAGGKQNGKLDFYQVHTYEWGSEFPIKRTADQYGLDKPLVVGEFSKRRSGGPNEADIYKHFYDGEYNGALAWLYTDHCDCDKDEFEVIDWGLEKVRHESSHGVVQVQIGSTPVSTQSSSSHIAAPCTEYFKKCPK